MYRHRVLVDVSHMRKDALDQTFALLRDLDDARHSDPKDFPLIASHSGFRCGRQAYNVDKDTVEEVARRGGVIGLILAQHQLNDGVRRRDTKDAPASMEVIFRHIDAIYGVTGNYDNIAIGSDLDGFIKPTMGGFEYAADLAKLREPLEHQYPGQADRILSGNALRVLEKAFAGRPAV
jgi:microsomal dipeptidase-like Zn-dependent dipeptidase